MGHVTRDEALAHAQDLVAAVAAARSLPDDFVLVARADGVMNGQYDLGAMARLQGYEQAGADCLYVPLPGSMDEQARICASTQLPVNALAAGHFTLTTHKQFADIGVARISLGSALAHVTHKAIYDAAVGMFEQGDFSGLGKGMSVRRWTACYVVTDLPVTIWTTFRCCDAFLLFFHQLRNVNIVHGMALSATEHINRTNRAR